MDYRHFLLASGALMALSCTHTVEAAFSEGADFSGFQRWDFRSAAVPRVSVPGANPERLERRLVRLIRDGLDDRGYAQAGGAPDFTVTYQLVVERTLESVRVPQAPYLLSSNDSTPSYWIGATDTEQRRVDQARLAIDVYDRQGVVVWKAAYRDRLERGRELDLEAAVRDLLARFPRARPSGTPRDPDPKRPPAARETASIRLEVGVI